MLKLPRDYALSIVLLVASGLLVLVLSLEWLHLSDVRSEMEVRLSAKPSIKLDETKPPDDRYELPAIQTFSDMIERPLFMEARRPPEDVPEEVETKVQETTPLTLKLMGIVVSPGGKTVLFLDPQGKYKRSHKNAVIQGWKLVSIENDRVVMEQNGQQKELPLIKPKQKSAAPQGKKPKPADDSEAIDGEEPSEDTADQPEEETDQSADEDTESDEATTDNEQ